MKENYFTLLNSFFFQSRYVVICGFLALVNSVYLFSFACFHLLLILALMLKLLFSKFLVLNVGIHGVYFQAQTVSAKAPCSNWANNTDLWHTAVVSKLMHLLETSHEIFCPLHLIRRGWDSRWGLEALEAIEMATLWQLQTRLMRQLVGCCRRMECQCLTNRPWNVIEMEKWDSALLHRNENCQQ